MLGAILEVAHLIWFLYNRLVFILVNVYYYFLNEFDHTNHIRSCQTTLSLRIPKHIALAFTNEADNADLHSIAKLLCWCKQLGIKNITIYDDRGKLKRNLKALYKHLAYQMSLLGHEKPIDRIEGLNVLSQQDGRQKFVEDVKSLLVESNEVDFKSVENCVGWPDDPELLISFGSPICLYGFPPWQLRLTEIMSLPTHRNLPQRIFTDCLIRYSRITQRLGA